MIFSITQILREINFEDSKSAKHTITTHLEVLNIDLNEFVNFWKLKFIKFNKIKGPKMVKMAV